MLCDEHIILKTYAYILFDYIYAWLACDDHTWCEDRIPCTDIVHIEPEEMTGAMRIVFPR